MTDTITTYIYSVGARRWYDIFTKQLADGKVYITDTPRKSEKGLVLTIELTPKQFVTVRKELGHYRDFNGEFIAANVSIFVTALKGMGIYIKSHTSIHHVAKSISTHKNYANKCVLSNDSAAIVSNTLN